MVSSLPAALRIQARSIEITNGLPKEVTERPQFASSRGFVMTIDAWQMWWKLYPSGIPDDYDEH
jgi:hypothetical protein